jgi:hypothetical protein
MKKSNIIFDDLIKFKAILKNDTNVSDVYISEFFMFISICISNKLQLIYPFAEFDKLIDGVIHNQKLKFAIMNHMNFKDNINKNILTIVHFTKNISTKLQDYFIDKMKEDFAHDTVSTKIESIDITFRVNNNSKYILNISNDSNVLTVKKFFIKYQNLNIDVDNLKLYNNKNELHDNNYLIENFICNDNDIIDVRIGNF